MTFQLWPTSSPTNENKEEQYFHGIYIRTGKDGPSAGHMACSAEGSSDTKFNVVYELCLNTETGFFAKTELVRLTEVELTKLRTTGKLSLPYSPYSDYLQFFLVGPYVFEDKEEIEEVKETVEKEILHKFESCEDCAEEQEYCVDCVEKELEDVEEPSTAQ